MYLSTLSTYPRVQIGYEHCVSSQGSYTQLSQQLPCPPKNCCPLSPPYSKALKPGFPFPSELDNRQRNKALGGGKKMLKLNNEKSENNFSPLLGSQDAVALFSGCAKEFWMIPCTSGDGPAYNIEGVDTLNQCMATCHLNERCKGFDWQPNSRKCWMMKVSFQLGNGNQNRPKSIQMAIRFINSGQTPVRLQCRYP